MANDLEATIEAQTKVLITLQKKNKALQEENEHLKKLVQQNAPVVLAPDSAGGLDEEIIARSELRKLLYTSNQRELSMEETKKVEIFSKILIAVQNKPKTIEINAKNMKTEDLLAIVESKDIEDTINVGE